MITFLIIVDVIYTNETHLCSDGVVRAIGYQDTTRNTPQDTTQDTPRDNGEPSMNVFTKNCKISIQLWYGMTKIPKSNQSRNSSRNFKSDKQII
jgi:hypothetical protein